jgi:hypothetical protein
MAVAQSSSDDLRRLAEQLILGYVDCVTKWVGENLIASATPSEMATGGHSACQNKLVAFEEAETRYLLSLGGSELGAISKAQSIAAGVRQMTREHIVRLIIETRSQR